MLSRSTIASRLSRPRSSAAGWFLLAALALFLLATSVPPGNPFLFSAVSLLPPDGIRFEGPSLVCSRPDVKELSTSAFRNGRFSVDIELRAARDDLRGPARIVALSRDPSLQNWLLGQHGSDLVVRHRGRETAFPKLLDPRRGQRLVLVFAEQEVTLFTPGAPPALARLEGPAAPWRDSCRFVLGNEATGDRPWEGEVRRLVLYDQPLTSTEVEGLFAATPAHGSSGAKRVLPELRLRTGPGGEVELVAESGATESLRIYRWTWSRKLAGHGGLWNLRSKRRSHLDLVANLLLTVPIGFFLTALLRQAGWASLYCLMAVIATQTLLSLGVETLQIFTPHRVADSRDIFVNVLGAALGWFLHRRNFGRWLQRRGSPP